METLLGFIIAYNLLVPGSLCSRNSLDQCSATELAELIEHDRRGPECVETGRRSRHGSLEYQCAGYSVWTKPGQEISK